MSKLNGLLLIGGKSSRMGTDKSELIFHGEINQKQRGIQLLESVCDEVFLSVAEITNTQEGNEIPDAFGSIGPLGAIASAQKAYPGNSWLVLACDLPLVEEKDLQMLVSARSADKNAVYFTSATDKLPEPLCAIWEKGTEQTVSEAITTDQRCPRNILKEVNSTALPSPGLWTLANTNTPADSLEILTRIHNSGTNKKITVSYYAQLREITGVKSESIQTFSTTPAGVFEEIRAKHNISLKRKGMMVAVNGEFTDWTHTLSEGDETVFIPPVAGG